MKILGIGNAIVDVICKVEDKFITQNNLTKSTMKLVDEVEFEKILSTLKIEGNCFWWISSKLNSRSLSTWKQSRFYR